MTQLLQLRQVRPSDRQVGTETRELARLARLGLPLAPTLVLRHAAWLAYLAAHEAQALWDAFCRQPDNKHAAPLHQLLAEQRLPTTLHQELHRQLAQLTAPVANAGLPALSDLWPIYGLRPDCVEHGSIRPTPRICVDAAGLDPTLRAVWADVVERWSYGIVRQATSSTTLSVLVQAIPSLDCCGELLTVAPDDPGCLQVSAVWGLAEPLFSRQTRPDRWLLVRAGGQVLSHEPGARQEAAWPGDAGVAMQRLPARAPAPLSPVTLDTLRILSLQIEHVVGGPLAIEWAHDGRRFWIIGVRPLAS